MNWLTAATPSYLCYLAMTNIDKCSIGISPDITEQLGLGTVGLGCPTEPLIFHPLWPMLPWYLRVCWQDGLSWNNSLEQPLYSVFLYSGLYFCIHRINQVKVNLKSIYGFWKNQGFCHSLFHSERTDVVMKAVGCLPGWISQISRKAHYQLQRNCSCFFSRNLADRNPAGAVFLSSHFCIG